jgi:hypothetical protein
MKKKLLALALLTTAASTFATPVSVPNSLSDTPIIGGITGGSGGQCKAYQTNGTAVDLSGGETLVFYGGGSNGGSAGGYLSTKSKYSGTAYLRTSGRDGYCSGYCVSGSNIGLFALQGDVSKNSFIAGAGAGFKNSRGGGWYGEGGGNIYSGNWFSEEIIPNPIYSCYRTCNRIKIGFKISWNCRNICNIIGYNYFSGGGAGFHGGNRAVGSGGGSSSISAYYNSPHTHIRDATSLGNTLTVTGGGNYGAGKPTLYVCQ